MHLGGARTALFNWLFARHHGGTFIVRVEDTDSARERPEFREEIFRALAWLGIDEDEGPTKGGAFGPYAQSARGDRYEAALASLERDGAVYPCFCVALGEKPADPSADGEDDAPQYEDRASRCRCAELSADEREAKRRELDEPPALRLRVDRDVAHVVDDIVRGHVVFPPGEVEDFIVAKAGRRPLYNFAAVVDDAAMEITHVIRGEEHLANTPKQLLLYRALGYEAPRFAHLPIILNTQRKKLSKRDGATAVSEYRAAGYLPDALRNFLALLGWSPGGDREIMTLDEMVSLFDLDRVQKSGAVFDQVKLTWMNGEYLRAASSETLVDALEGLLAGRDDASQLRRDRAHLAAVVGLLRERAKTVAEIAAASYLFSHEATLAWEPEAIAKRAGTPEARAKLASLRPVLAESPSFDHVALEERLRAFAAEAGAKAGDFIAPLRVAITGTAVSPGIFELCEVLGRDVTTARIDAFLAAYPAEAAAR